MYFTKSLTTTLLSALYIAGGVRADDCTDGPMNSLQAWGYPGKPTHFCHTQWKQGLVVTGIEVWATAWQIKGIQMTYSDGNKVMEGQREGDRHDSLYWKPSSPVTAMKLAVNYAGDGLGLVHVEAEGKKLDVRSDTGSFDGDNIDVASGILLGASGDNGGFITAWAPHFLGTVEGTAKVVDLKFNDNLDEINKKQQGIKSATVSSVYIKNSNPINATNADQSWQFHGDTAVTVSNSFSSSSERVFSMSETLEISATVGVPMIDDVSISSTTTVGYNMSDTWKQGNETSYEIRVGQFQGSTETSDLIKPGHAKFCTTSAMVGTYDGNYVATINIHVNGKDFKLLRPGNFAGTSYADGSTDCHDVLIKDIPRGAKVVTAGSTMDQNTKKRAVKFLA